MTEVRFPRQERGDRAVCKRCGMVMDDGEPMSSRAEFHHKDKHRDGTKSKCANAGRTFYFDHHVDAWKESAANEVEFFMRKRTRRAAKRATR